MPNKIITIQLQSVEYGGDNLGDDIRLDLTVIGARKGDGVSVSVLEVR